MQIYFDHAASSFPKAPGVAEAMGRYLNQVGANVNRGSYESASAASFEVLKLRESLCQLFNFSSPEHAVICPGNTFSINQVLKGYLRPGDHVLTTAMEHNALARPLEQLSAQGIAYTCVPCDHEGLMDPEDLRRAIRPNTRLVALQHASNVSGGLMLVAEIGLICQQAGIPLMLDAAQSAGHIPVDFEALHLSALCVPGHKGLLGPQGIGALLVRQDFALQLSPLIAGGTGSQSASLNMPATYPDCLEAGTPNLPGIYGLTAALEWLLSQDMAALHQQEMALCAQFMDGVKALPGIRILGPQTLKNRVAVVSLDFPEQDNAAIAWRLEEEGQLCLRCGLHCAPLAHQTLGSFPQGAVRFSFSHSNTKEQVDSALCVLRRVMGISS